MAVAGDIGVCHADCQDGSRKATCDQGCSSGREVAQSTLALACLRWESLEQKAAPDRAF